MDFSNSGSRVAPTAPHTPVQQPMSSHSGKSKKTSGLDFNKLIQIVMLFSIAVLSISMIAVLAFGKGVGINEGRFVKSDQYQAVFLNGGQVYFGKVGKLNSQYMTLSDIYYLRVNQQVQPGTQQTQQDVSLAKLGCELHGPEDGMVINRDQVVFWENLKAQDKDQGQVVDAIKRYQESEDSKKSCADRNTATQQQTTNNETTNNESTNGSN